MNKTLTIYEKRKLLGQAAMHAERAYDFKIRFLKSKSLKNRKILDKAEKRERELAEKLMKEVGI